MEINGAKKQKTKKAKIKTIKGISKLYYWEWPVEGKYSGYIRARSLPYIGERSNFTPAYVANLWNSPLHRPQPNISEHTTPESKWTILISKGSSKYCHIIN